jgi:[protein-PII] uridylyltransferase
MYHVYTTDEHTIFTIGILGQIERQELVNEYPLASEEIRKVLSRDVLYAAMFLHDIAKGRGGNHPALGAEVATQLGPRFGFKAEETESISWLVRNHLVFSDTAFRRDLDDPKTIADLVSIVKSRERLRLLLCLTVADISAVGPGIWNEWKATLLRELYHRADDLMSVGLEVKSRASQVDAVKRSLRKRLVEWPPDELDSYIEGAELSYWLAYDREQLIEHAEMVREAGIGANPVGSRVKVDPSRAATGITIYGTDQPGLFRRIAGVLSIAGVNVVEAKVSTLKNGMVLDSFWFQNALGGVFDDKGRLSRLEAMVRRAVSIDVNDWPPLPAHCGGYPRPLAFTVMPRVLVDNQASNTHTVLEINGLDRSGLLYDVTDAITKCELQISAAKASTYGEQVVDVFYVKDNSGMKVEHPSRLDSLRDALLSVLQVAAAAA